MSLHFFTIINAINTLKRRHLSKIGRQLIDIKLVRNMTSYLRYSHVEKEWLQISSVCVANSKILKQTRAQKLLEHRKINTKALTEILFSFLQFCTEFYELFIRACISYSTPTIKKLLRAYVSKIWRSQNTNCGKEVKSFYADPLKNIQKLCYFTKLLFDFNCFYKRWISK